MRSRDCFFKKNNTMYIVPKLFQNAVCVPQRIKIYAMEEFWHWDSCTICFGRRDHLTFIMTSCLFHKIDSSGGFFLKSFTIGLCVCNMRQCNLKRSRRTVIFLPVYKISSLKITPLKLQTLDSFRICYRTLFHFYLKKKSTRVPV
jgi:hypothetical protein